MHICDMTHSYVWHDAFVCDTWLIRVCDMTHSYVWHDSFVRVILHGAWEVDAYVWHDSFIRVMTHSHIRWTGLTHWDPYVCVWHDASICTQWFLRHDSFMCVTWRIYMHVCDMTHLYLFNGVCGMTHSYSWYSYGSFICDMTLACRSYVTWHISCPWWMRLIWSMHMWHDLFIGFIWLIHTYDMTYIMSRMNDIDMVHANVTWFIHRVDMAHSYVWHDSFIFVAVWWLDIRWLRLVGSLKL